MSDIFQLPISKLCSLIQTNELSAEFVLSKYFNRIKEHNADLNAIISVVSEQYLFEEARAIDKIRNKNSLKKPLLGMPIAIKDLEATKGIETTYGSEIFRNNIPKKDGTIANKIRSAGAIIIGKTNTPEFGIGSHTFNKLFGSTKNPYDKTRSAGGSSGGAACAIAAGLLPTADGSDMMGSLRNPAAFNNIYGFRPTVGLIPNEHETQNTSLILSTNGPMGKFPEDLVFLLDIMIDHNRIKKKPLNIGKKIWNTQVKSLKGINIGWLSDLVDQYHFEDGILDMCLECLDTLSYCGAEVSPTISKIPRSDLWSSWISLRSVNLKNSIGSMFDLEKNYHYLKTEILWEIKNADTINDRELQTAMDVQKKINSMVNSLFKRYDFLALPSAAVFPFDINLRYPKNINKKAMDTYHRWMEVVVLVSLLGLPCISLPCGLNSQGLPTGLQIFGRPYSDIEILSLAQTYSNTTDKDKLRPTLE